MLQQRMPQTSGQTLRPPVSARFALLSSFAFLVAGLAFLPLVLQQRLETAVAATGINKQMSFQGRVVNTNGTNVSNGTFSFTFAIYDVASGGSAIWTETKTLTVTNGVFATNLGSVTSLPGSLDFNTDSYYLGINFNGDGEMTPRIRMTAVAQAFNAERVNGLTVTASTGTLTIPNATTISFGGQFTTVNSNPISLAAAVGGSTITLPASGTLATLAGTETFTNKTIGDNLTFSGASTPTINASGGSATLQINTTDNRPVTFGSGLVTTGGSVSIGANLGITGTLQVTSASTLTGVVGVGTSTSASTALNIVAGTTSVSSLRIATGVAPTTPVVGDIWSTGTRLNFRTSALANESIAYQSDLTSAVSGTSNYIAKFTSSNVVGNSQVFDNGTGVAIGGASPASLFNVGASNQFQVNSSGAIAAVTGITTTGGYTQTGTSPNSISGTTTFSRSGTTAIIVSGTPAATGGSSLIQIGSAITGGSSGGAYLGINAANGFTGNYFDFQTNSSNNGRATLTSGSYPSLVLSNSSNNYDAVYSTNLLSLYYQGAASFQASPGSLAISDSNSSFSYFNTTAAGLDVTVNDENSSTARTINFSNAYGSGLGVNIKGTLTVGDPTNGFSGTLGLSGSTSGTITIQPQAAAGTYNFNLPTTAGTSGYVLTSAGGGASAMTWTDPAALAVRWNSITNPSGNLSLSMGTNTTTFDYATGTSTNNLLNLTTAASSNGTGYLLNIATGASSTVKPLRVNAAGTDILTVSNTGAIGIGADTTFNAAAKLYLNNSDNSNYYYLDNPGTTGSANSVLRFLQGNVGEAARFGASGKFGLGTTTLTSLLNVGTSAAFQVTAAGNTGIQGNPTYAPLVVGGSNGSDAGLEVVPGSGVIVQSYNRNTSAYATLTLDGSLVNIRPGGVSKVTIDSSAIASSISYTQSGTSANTFTGATTFSRTGTNALAVTGTPAASAASSLVQLGIPLSGGSADGTYLGINTSLEVAADFIHIQNQSSTVFRVGAYGDIYTPSAYNTPDCSYSGGGMQCSSIGGIYLRNSAGGIYFDDTPSVQLPGGIMVDSFGLNLNAYPITNAARLSLAGSTSGTITIQPQAAAGTYNFNLPTTAGTSGYVLTSAGGGASAMTWTDPAALAVRWNSITNPSGNLSLSMGTNTTTFDYATGTSTNNLLNLTTAASSNGTGYLLNIATGASSTVKPLRVNAAGTDILTVSNTGAIGIASGSAVTFGGDTNIYRSAADYLRTDDSLRVGGNLSLGEDPSTYPYQKVRVTVYPSSDNQFIGLSGLVWNDNGSYTRTNPNNGALFDHYWWNNTTTTAGMYGGTFNMYVGSPLTSGSFSNGAGGRFQQTWDARGGAGNSLWGGQFIHASTSSTTGGVTAAAAGRFEFSPNSAANYAYTNAYGLSIISNLTASASTNFYGIHIATPSAGSVTNAYGLYVADQTVGTNRWNIYSAGTGANYLGGPISTVSGYTQTGTGANTFSGATTFSASSTGLSVTNNASIGGFLNITGETYAGSNVYVNATGSTSGAPRVIGINNFGSGTAAQFLFGDTANAIQSSFGGKMQLAAYWGVEIGGNRQASSTAFVSGGASDASLLVYGTQTAAPVLVVKAPSSISANLQEWQNSSSTVLARITSSGGLEATSTLAAKGSSSGTVTIATQAAAGTYNFNLPTTAGTSGYVLTSAGGGASAMTWTDPAALAVRWNSITNPSGNLSLSMGTNTTTFDYATGTSTNNLLNLTTAASSNGTGYLLNIATGASSTVKPLRVNAAGTDILTVSNTGATTLAGATTLTGSGTALTVNNDAAISGNLGLGTAASSNAFQALTIFKTGVLSSGTTNLTNLTVWGSGDAGGTSDLRALLFSVVATGSNNLSALTAIQGDAAVQTTTGTTGVVAAASANIRVQGAGNVSSGYGYRAIPIFSSSGNITDWRAFEARTPSISSTGKVTTRAHGLYVENLGVSGLTNAYGVYVAAQSGATNNYAIYLAGTSGTAADGITIGGDTNIYRGAADQLKTDDTLVVARTGANALALTGAPATSSISSLLQLGSALAGGNLGGTYIGINAGSGFNGDVLNFQKNGASLFSISSFTDPVVTLNAASGSYQSYFYPSTMVIASSLGDAYTASPGNLTLTNGSINNVNFTASSTGLDVTLADDDIGSSRTLTFSNTYGSGLSADIKGTLTVGDPTNGFSGTLGLSGSTSGTITIQPQAAAGTYNFNLPTTAGTSGYVLTSAGGGASAMTWTDPAALAVRWNSITNPSGNLSLSMGTNTTTFDYATGTSTNNLLNLTTAASSNGTGYLLNIATGASSTVKPLRVNAAGTDILTVSNTGATTVANSFYLSSSIATGATGQALKLNTSTWQVERDTSSARYKHDINDYNQGLAIVQALRPVSFKWNANTGSPNAPDIGFIAEEVATVLPDVVVYSNGLPDGIRYDRLTIPLVLATKELSSRLSVVEGDMALAKVQIADLQSRAAVNDGSRLRFARAISVRAAVLAENLFIAEDANGTERFVVDPSGAIATGNSLPGIPTVGVDPTSGTDAGSLTGSSSPLYTSVSDLTATVRKGVAFTSNALNNGSSTRRCVVASDQALSIPANSTKYLALVANGALTDQGQACGIQQLDNIPAFSATAPVLVIAQLTTNASEITQIIDTRFFIGANLGYAEATTAVLPGQSVRPSAAADNAVELSTSGRISAGIVAIGSPSAGRALIYSVGRGYVRSADSSATRGSRAVNSQVTEGAISGETDENLTGQLGSILTTRTTLRPSVLVQVLGN